MPYAPCQQQVISQRSKMTAMLSVFGFLHAVRNYLNILKCNFNKHRVDVSALCRIDCT